MRDGNFDSAFVTYWIMGFSLPMRDGNVSSNRLSERTEKF